MSIETLTYAALGAELKISAEAARSLARRRRLPRSLSEEGKVLVSVDLAEIRHKPQSSWGRQADNNIARPAEQIEALNAEIARLEAEAAGCRADLERERQRGDGLVVELQQANAETIAARKMTARLEAEVADLRTRGRAGGSIDSHGQAARLLGHLAAAIVEADRKACK
jgi:chromosome segregation ATPase